MAVNRSQMCEVHDSAHISNQINPIALRMAKTPESFGHSECNRVKDKYSNVNANLY